MSTGKPLDVICMGRAGVDLYGEQIGGLLEDMGSFAKYIGGCPANIAVGTARMGLKSSLLSRVGDEHMGRFIRGTLEAEGVDVSHLKTDKERLTALVFLGIRDRETFPLIFYRENCADMALSEDDFDAAFIASAKALVVTGTHLSKSGVRKASFKAAECARAAGTKVVFDIDYRPVLWGLTDLGQGEERFVANAAVSESVAEMLPYSDLIVGTEEEFHIAGGSTDTIRALKTIREKTAATLVLKLGPQGCTVFEGAIPETLADNPVHAGFPVEVFNVLGAGDAFMSGLLRGYIAGLGWKIAAALRTRRVRLWSRATAARPRSRVMRKCAISWPTAARTEVCGMTRGLSSFTGPPPATGISRKCWRLPSITASSLRIWRRNPARAVRASRTSNPCATARSPRQSKPIRDGALAFFVMGGLGRMPLTWPAAPASGSGDRLSFRVRARSRSRGGIAYSQRSVNGRRNTVSNAWCFITRTTRRRCAQRRNANFCD